MDVNILTIASGLMLFGLMLLVIAIYLVLKELRDLKILFMHEESKINRFEEDIIKLEEMEDKRDIDKLQRQIGIELKKGYDWREIKERMMKQGWKASELEKVYKYVINNFVGLRGVKK